MFERNRVDNANEPSAVPVELGMVDGEVVKGRVMVPMGKTAIDLINGPAPFIEVEPYSGERCLIAKSQIATVRLVGIPKAGHLGNSRTSNDFEPHKILGLQPGATWDEVRQAYVQMTKVYHPDRYAGAALPAEVRDYLDATVRRINAAYAALEVPHQVAKLTPRRATAERAQPIYTSPGR